MNRIVMIASALVMAILGIAATFLPQETLAYAGIAADGVLLLVIQLTGALYLSFAMMNWTAKESVIGGIYNRPIAIANFLHFLMGALALGKGVAANPSARVLLPLAIVYVLLALAFAKIFFTSPVREAQQQKP